MSIYVKKINLSLQEAMEAYGVVKFKAPRYSK
jgi:hypothetical protein